jgi:SAM-dependent methyltransferase
VLDLCCGVAGPGRLVTRELGCTYLGVDYSPSALAIARERAVGLDCRFEVALVPPVPRGPFDVVMLLETMLAFPDKAELLQQIAAVLRPGGRFAFTLEEGLPLTEAERDAMPDADTVWLTPLPEIVALLDGVGVQVRSSVECSDAHLAMVDALIAAFESESGAISAQVGDRALDELVAAHRLWSDWLREGRVRKIAFVAEKTETQASARSSAG